MKLKEYIKQQIELGTDEFDIRVDIIENEIVVAKNGMHKIKFKVNGN